MTVLDKSNNFKTLRFEYNIENVQKPKTTIEIENFATDTHIYKH